MARTSKTMLNNSGESGHPSLVTDLRGSALSCFVFCFLFFTLFYFTILYWFCHTLT